MTESNPDKFIYDLFGVVNHHGHASFGHYTANIRVTSSLSRILIPQLVKFCFRQQAEWQSDSHPGTGETDGLQPPAESIQSKWLHFDDGKSPPLAPAHHGRFTTWNMTVPLPDYVREISPEEVPLNASGATPDSHPMTPFVRLGRQSRCLRPLLPQACTGALLALSFNWLFRPPYATTGGIRSRQGPALTGYHSEGGEQYVEAIRHTTGL